MKSLEKLYPTNAMSYSEQGEYYIDSKDEQGNNIYNGPIDLDSVAIIEQKLKAYSTYYNECRNNNVQPEYTNYGITMEEAKQYLDWIVYRSRDSITKQGAIDANTCSFTGSCNPTQQQVSCVMDKIIGSENVHPINTESIISHPDKDVIKRQYSTAVRHCITVASLPILDENNNVSHKDFLIDPTFRQFCLSKNCNTARYDLKNEYYNKVAPDSAFFLNETEEGKKLAETLVYSGYTVFDEKTAKIYGDAFSKASIGIEGLPFDINEYRPYDLEEVSKYKAERFDGQKYVFDIHDVKSSFVKNGSEYLEAFKSKNNEMKREYSHIPQGYEMTIDDIKEKEQAKFSNKIKNFFKTIIGSGKNITRLSSFKMPPVVSKKKDDITNVLSNGVNNDNEFYKYCVSQEEREKVNSHDLHEDFTRNNLR